MHEGNRGTLVFHGLQNWASFRTWAKERGFSRVMVLVDGHTAQYCLPLFEERWGSRPEVIEMPAGEAAKILDTAARLWDRLAALTADRNTLLICLGGGVVTDMGGFVASTFKRGLTFVHVPTSLLGMVDAAIGGKTGIDLVWGKNLVGTFAAPEALLIDADFLDTLPEEEWISGKAEMLKHGLIADRDLWRRLATMDRPDGETIRTASVIKEHIVAKDPFEKGLRRILNFGHTLGHALESNALAQGREIRHGEAIWAGMLMEAWISVECAGLPGAEWEEIRSVLSAPGPTVDPLLADPEACLPFVRQDKKNSGGSIRMVLLPRIGAAVHDIPVEEGLIREALSGYGRLTGR